MKLTWGFFLSASVPKLLRLLAIWFLKLPLAINIPSQWYASGNCVGCLLNKTKVREYTLEEFYDISAAFLIKGSQWLMGNFPLPVPTAKEEAHPTKKVNPVQRCTIQPSSSLQENKKRQEPELRLWQRVWKRQSASQSQVSILQGNLGGTIYRNRQVCRKSGFGLVRGPQVSHARHGDGRGWAGTWKFETWI